MKVFRTTSGTHDERFDKQTSQRDHALRLQLPERNVNGPIRTGIKEAGKIGTFPDAHSGVAIWPRQFFAAVATSSPFSN